MDEILFLSELCAPDPFPVAREPWLRNPSKADGLTFLPAAGWHLAGRLAKAGSLSDALHGPRFFWIREAAAWIGRNGTPQGRAAVPLRSAKEIHDDPVSGRLLNCLLMATDSSANEVASLVGRPPLAIKAYDQLFFNVLDRKQDILYLAALCAADGADHAVGGGDSPLRLDPRSTIAEVMVLAGFGDSTALDPAVLRRRQSDKAFRDWEGFPKTATRGAGQFPQMEDPAIHSSGSSIGALIRGQLDNDRATLNREMAEKVARQNQTGERIVNEDQRSAE